MLQRIYPYLTGVILLRDTASKPAITITVWDSIISRYYYINNADVDADLKIKC
mgnify:CR=1 FL=1